MRTIETDRDGSFIACGVGVFYKYTAKTHTLEIFRQQKRTYLFNLSLEGIPQRYVGCLIDKLDRAAQIKALMISNYKTNNITLTMTPDKLPAILQSAFQVALYAFDAKAGHWKKLTIALQQDFELKQFKLKRLLCPSAGVPYIRAAVKTKRDNEITLRERNLVVLMQNLSERIMQDLIMVEFAYRQDSQAHKLVSLSSRLATMARVMDPAYNPKEQVFVARKPAHKETLQGA